MVRREMTRLCREQQGGRSSDGWREQVQHDGAHHVTIKYEKCSSVDPFALTTCRPFRSRLPAIGRRISASTILDRVFFGGLVGGATGISQFYFQTPTAGLVVVE